MDPPSLSIEERKKLQKAISNGLKFLDPTDKYQCQNCQQIALHHRMPKCKHPCCLSCYDKCKVATCKICGEKNTEFSQDPQFDENLLSLMVECMFQSTGCNEKVALLQFLKHTSICKYSTKATLPKQWKGPPLDETNAKAIKELSEKVEQISGITGDLKERSRNHDETLESIKEQLASIMAQLNLIKEWNEAKEASYEQLKTVITKNEEDMNIKFDIISNNVHTRDQDVATISKKLYLVEASVRSYAGLKVPYHHNGTGDDEDSAGEQEISSVLVPPPCTLFEWKIEGFREKLDSLHNKIAHEIESDTFKTVDHHFNMKAKLISEFLDYLSFKVGFLPAGPKTDALPMYAHRRTFTLVDQSKRSEKRHIVYVEEPGFGNTEVRKMMQGFQGPFNFPPINVLRRDDAYVKQNTAIFKILIEPLSVLYSQCTNKTGRCLIEVKDYSKRKQEEIDGVTQCIRSEYFMTSEDGYRMQTSLYLNGIRKENRGIHFSVCHGFLRGERDEELNPKFSHKTSISILDPKDKKHPLLTKSRSAKGTLWDCFDDFVKLYDIENSTYMHDDTLYVEVAVEDQ